MPPRELLPDPKLLNHLPSEDLLRDLAQLPGCWGKGSEGPGSSKRWEVLTLSEGPLPGTLDFGALREKAEGEARRRYTD